MDDATLFCKTCGDYKDHMHFKGPTCICSECGGNTAAPNWREIEAAMEARKKANQAAVASRNMIGAPGLEPKLVAETQKARIAERYLAGESEADLAKEYSVSGKLVRKYVAQARSKARQNETNETKGETNMPKGKKLTDQDKADIVRLRGEGKKVSEIAKDFHVSEVAVYYVLKNAKAGRPAKVEKAAKAPKTEKGTRIPKTTRKPQGEAVAAAGAAFNDSQLTTLVKDAVHIQVSAYLASLDQRIAVRVRDVLREVFK